MKSAFVRIVLSILAISTLLLGGCSDFDEMKGERLLINAEAQLEQGNEEQAVEILSDLVAKYPSTQAGEVAGKHLYRIKKQRERRERQEFGKVLDSYRQVLNGYRSLYAGYPNSVKELDESGYFFDSAYLEELTPNNYTVYLWLKDDGSGYRIWCINSEKKRGYAIESLDRKLVPFERDEIVNKLKSRFRTIDWNAKLVVLQQKE